MCKKARPAVEQCVKGTEAQNKRCEKRNIEAVIEIWVFILRAIRSFERFQIGADTI